MKKVFIFISFLAICGSAMVIAEKPVAYNDTIVNNDSTKTDTIIYRCSPVINTPMNHVQGQ